MPFCSGLKNHVPSLSDLFDCLGVKGREHELLAWVVQNNTERENILFTPLEKTEDGKYMASAWQNTGYLGIPEIEEGAMLTLTFERAKNGISYLRKVEGNE